MCVCVRGKVGWVGGHLRKRRGQKGGGLCASAVSLCAGASLSCYLNMDSIYKPDTTGIITIFTLVFAGMLLALAGVSSSISEARRLTRVGAGGTSMVGWWGWAG